MRGLGRETELVPRGPTLVPQTIGPGHLYLGGFTDLENLRGLNALDIGAIVSLHFHPYDSYYLSIYTRSPKSRLYIHEISDTVDGNLTAGLDKGVAFIADHLRKGTNVFVHCYAGRSRSVCMVLATLCAAEDPIVTLDVALQRVGSVRPIIAPNIGLLRQVHRWLYTRTPTSAVHTRRRLSATI